MREEREADGGRGGGKKENGGWELSGLGHWTEEFLPSNAVYSAT